MNQSADNPAAAFNKRSGLMRVAIPVMVIVLTSSLPALASPSCMTQSEARQKFATAHLWWHGPNRCWDATPPSRQRLAQRNKLREAKQAKRESIVAREVVEENKSEPPSRWRDAMSRATTADLAGATAPARAEAGISIVAPEAEAFRVDWRERWVDISQRFPSPAEIDKGASKPRPADLAAEASAVEPLVTPARVMLMLLVLLLALGAFELLRRPARRS